MWATGRTGNELCYWEKKAQAQTEVVVVVPHMMCQACWRQQEENQMRGKMLEHFDDHEQRQEVWTLQKM